MFARADLRAPARPLALPSMKQGRVEVFPEVLPLSGLVAAPATGNKGAVTAIEPSPSPMDQVGGRGRSDEAGVPVDGAEALHDGAVAQGGALAAVPQGDNTTAMEDDEVDETKSKKNVVKGDTVGDAADAMEKTDKEDDVDGELVAEDSGDAEEGAVILLEKKRVTKPEVEQGEPGNAAGGSDEEGAIPNGKMPEGSGNGIARLPEEPQGPSDVQFYKEEMGRLRAAQGLIAEVRNVSVLAEVRLDLMATRAFTISSFKPSIWYGVCRYPLKSLTCSSGA